VTSSFTAPGDTSLSDATARGRNSLPNMWRSLAS